MGWGSGGGAMRVFLNRWAASIGSVLSNKKFDVGSPGFGSDSGVAAT